MPLQTSALQAELGTEQGPPGRAGEGAEQLQRLLNQRIGASSIAACRNLSHGRQVLFDRSLSATGGLEMRRGTGLVSLQMSCRPAPLCHLPRSAGWLFDI
jgi:hypothetical protein